MGNFVDALCTECGRPMRWLSGTRQICPLCAVIANEALAKITDHKESTTCPVCKRPWSGATLDKSPEIGV